MFHINIIKDSDVAKVQKEILVDGQMYVDEAPTAGSTNLVTSGGVAKGIGGAVNSLSGSEHDDIEINIPNPTEEYEVGKFYYFGTTFNLCTAYSASEATFTPYSICEALNYLKGLVDALGE